MIRKIKLTTFALTFYIPFALLAQCPTLVWEDNFEGNSLDPNSWEFMIGDGCSHGICNWGNDELQFYTNQNAEVSDGTLKIIAKQQQMGGLSYSSARIRTKNRVDLKYGRIEGRMKMPGGKGLWPAFRMLSTEETNTGLPQSGEIDIMQSLGRKTEEIHRTMHYGQRGPNNGSSGKRFTINDEDFNNSFHDFAIEWKENEIKWYMDGYHYYTRTNTDLDDQDWPFDKDFHFLLNLAVGGNSPGTPDGSTVFPQTFEIDYVRVYDMTGFPTISGPQNVPLQAKGVEFEILNSGENAEIIWELPGDASIANHTHLSKISVNFGNESGVVKAVIKSDCGERVVNLNVNVECQKSADLVLENFDNPEAKILRTISSGDYLDNFANPDKSEANESDLCGKYLRNSASQNDVLVFGSSAISNANAFVDKEKKFSLAIWTDAPIGTEILLQLEDKSAATSENFPKGRHSRYSVLTSVQNSWEILEFDFVDQPDNNIATNNVDELVILFNPNSSTGHTYYYDNFTVLSVSNGETHDLKNLDKVENITIFPNPAEGNVTVSSLNGTTISSIRVYNIAGAPLIKKDKLRTLKRKIDVSGLINGIYYVEVITADKKRQLNKIVKK